jgi:secreted trypsin-like serine protease
MNIVRLFAMMAALGGLLAGCGTPTENPAMYGSPVEFSLPSESETSASAIYIPTRTAAELAAGKRAVRGGLTPAGSFASTVGLNYGRPGTTFCSGVLLSRWVILTAAHCVCRKDRPSHIFVGEEPGASGAYHALRRERRLARDECPSSMAKPQLRLRRDLALLRLQRPVPDAKRAQLAPEGLLTRDGTYVIAGFGALDQAGRERDDRKRYAVVPIASVECGEATAPAQYGCLPREEMVAGGDGEADTCDGDSGGPLFVSARDGAGAERGENLFLAGVTSRPVLGSNRQCGKGGVYERMSPAARQWLARELKTFDPDHAPGQLK